MRNIALENTYWDTILEGKWNDIPQLQFHELDCKQDAGEADQQDIKKQ